MKGKNIRTQFAVLGLGRFGASVVRTLADYDVNILACDKDEIKLQRAAEIATHVVKCDLSDENALMALGLGNFDVVILAMGQDFEASQIAAMIAKEEGAGRVVVKAQSIRQKKILESIGADEVILPEHEIGARLARRLVNPNIMDIFEDSEFYTITEMHPLEDWAGKTLRQSDIRRREGMTVMAIRRGKRLIIPGSPDTVIEEGDVLIVLSENPEKRPVH